MGRVGRGGEKNMSESVSLNGWHLRTLLFPLLPIPLGISPLRALFFPRAGASPSCSPRACSRSRTKSCCSRAKSSPLAPNEAARAVAASSRRSRQVAPAPPPRTAPTCSGDSDKEPPRGCRLAAGEGADEAGRAAGWKEEEEPRELQRRRRADPSGTWRRNRRDRRGSAGGGRPRPGAPTTTAPSARGMMMRRRSRHGRRDSVGGERPHPGAPTKMAPSVHGVTTRRRMEAGETALA
ncbi:hypothetical protein PAHAL_2G139800 [Panicum hallii]|uniref:Uncharacterized protein n=1 Tax=Panicum hallii TaxID=206008 RepID=A0A2T8KP72_9POAL|nr:hypothetical protein PAHAL_2G139800 [Panicum hallii]